MYGELVILEFRKVGKATEARNFAKKYGVRIAPVSARLYERLLLSRKRRGKGKD